MPESLHALPGAGRRMQASALEDGASAGLSAGPPHLLQAGARLHDAGHLLMLPARPPELLQSGVGVHDALPSGFLGASEPCRVLPGLG